MTVLRRLLSIVVCFGLLAGWAKAEDPSKLPQPTSYVSDFAGVIDGPSRESIEAIARQVAAKAHATIVVVTVHSLDGETIEEFTTALEDKWKVGPKGSDRGVVMVFAIAEHKRRIEVGYGLEGVLNDAKVGDIGRSMVPQLQAGAYGPAILGGVRQIAQDIAGDAGVSITAPQPVPQPVYRQRTVRRHSNWGGIVFLIIFLFLAFRGGGRGGRGGGGGWMWFLLGNMLGGGFGGGRGGGGGGGFGGGGGGGGDDGGNFGGGFGGGSGGGGASGDW